GEPLRRRWFLGDRRPVRSQRGVRRVAGWLHRPRRPPDDGVARYPADRRLQGEAAVQLELADRGEPDPEGHDLPRLAVPVPLARPGRELAADLARPDHQRSGEAEAG